MDTLFQLSNLLVVPFWLLAIFLPQWRWTERILRSPYVVLPPALLYVTLVVPGLLDVLPLLARPDLATIAGLLGTPEGAAIAWAHFVTLDLFAGRWVYLDSRAAGLSPWIGSPLLLVVLMFAPLGLTLYLGARAVNGAPAAAER